MLESSDVELGGAAGLDAGYIADIRHQMVQFARQQLSDLDQAEDAVQDALAGALRNRVSFEGRAALKTWIFAILKNKIADILRAKMRHVSRERALVAEADVDRVAQLFDARGNWRSEERPSVWGNPEAALHDTQFWTIFDACLNRLPPRQARIFMMREFVGLETNEICAALDVSISNVHVMLHRARLGLRECLEDNWFAEGPASC